MVFPIIALKTVMVVIGLLFVSYVFQVARAVRRQRSA